MKELGFPPEFTQLPEVDPETILANNPPEEIGKGHFGRVYLASIDVPTGKAKLRKFITSLYRKVLRCMKQQPSPSVIDPKLIKRMSGKQLAVKEIDQQQSITRKQSVLSANGRMGSNSSADDNANETYSHGHYADYIEKLKEAAREAVLQYETRNCSHICEVFCISVRQKSIKDRRITVLNIVSPYCAGGDIPNCKQAHSITISTNGIRDFL